LKAAQPTTELTLRLGQLSGGRSAVVNAVGNGINVIEPGGNGNDDTDQLSWLENSGAIIVGAGAVGPSDDLHRWPESSYGTRFDLQGWGENIVTTGRGDLYGGEEYDSAFTASFGATSGASAMVAGAVADLVGFWKQNISPSPPSPDSVRSLLKWTGTPQLPNPMGHVGPHPDLRRAIGELIETGVWSPKGRPAGPVVLDVVPSPLNAAASVLIETPGKSHVKLELFSPAGRLVRVLFDGDTSSGKHSFEWNGQDDQGYPVASGVYVCRLVSGRAKATRRVVVVR
jgi:hypothetical protein